MFIYILHEQSIMPETKKYYRLRLQWHISFQFIFYRQTNKRGAINHLQFIYVIWCISLFSLRFFPQNWITVPLFSWTWTEPIGFASSCFIFYKNERVKNPLNSNNYKREKESNGDMTGENHRRKSNLTDQAVLMSIRFGKRTTN